MASKEVEIKLRANFGEVTGGLREIEYLSYRIIGIFGRLGLPTQLDAAIAKMSGAVLGLRMVHSSLMFMGRAQETFNATQATVQAGQMTLGMGPRGGFYGGKLMKPVDVKLPSTFYYSSAMAAISLIGAIITAGTVVQQVNAARWAPVQEAGQY